MINNWRQIADALLTVNLTRIDARHEAVECYCCVYKCRSHRAYLRLSNVLRNYNRRELEVIYGCNQKTPNKSASYRGVSIIILVHHLELFLHEIRDEIARWRVILAVPYREYVSFK